MSDAQDNLDYARKAAYRVIHACRCRGERPNCMTCSCALEALENAAVQFAGALRRVGAARPGGEPDGR